MPVSLFPFTLQEISSDLADSQDFTEGVANVTVTRTQRASPPLQGTFDIEIYGQRVEGNIQPFNYVIGIQLIYVWKCNVEQKH